MSPAPLGFNSMFNAPLFGSIPDYKKIADRGERKLKLVQNFMVVRGNQITHQEFDENHNACMRMTQVHDLFFQKLGQAISRKLRRS